MIVAGLQQQMMIFQFLKNCCLILEKCKNSHGRARMMNTRWENLMTISNVPLRMTTTASPVLDRAKAKFKVSVSAPSVAENDADI